MIDNFDDLQQEVRIFMVERQQLVMAGAVAISALLIIFFAIWPMWGKNQEFRSEMKTLQRQVKNTTQQKSIIESAIDNSEQLQRVNAALPLYKQPLTNLLQISQVASQSGVIISEYSLNPGVVSTDSAELDKKSKSISDPFVFQVVLEGQVDQVREAFRLIETSLPLIEIESFNLSSSGSRNEDGQEVRSTVELDLVAHSAFLEASDLKNQKIEDLNSEQLAALDKLKTYTLPSPGNQIQPRFFENADLFRLGN